MASSLRKTLLSLVSLLLVSAAGACGEGYDAADYDLVIAAHAGAVGPLSATTEAGELLVHELTIALGSLELRACDELADRGERSGVRDRLMAWLSPTAWAHSPSTPTRNGIPVLADLLGDEAGFIPSALRPPVGRSWCGVTAVFFAADDDAIGLAALPEMEGAALRFSARVGASPVALVSSRSFELRASFGAPVVLSGRGTLSLLLNRELMATGLGDRLSEAHLNNELELNRVLVEVLTAAVSVHVEELP